MTIHHFIYISLFLLSFSGVPPGGEKVEPVTAEIRLPLNDRNEDDEFIPWVLQRKLVWNDFSAEPKKHSEAVASTSTSLGISYQVNDGILEYRITCNFSKHKSWGSLKTDYILAHEQGHFDITEIAARKLHGALSQYIFDPENYKRDINEIYQGIVKEKENMQAEYDHLTDHSRNRRIQYEWQRKIDSVLMETAMWSMYP